ncbi:MAG: periplasmic heavy metal sensor [Tistlia sp.]|uniref:periplasmic heavy metal sensor n=1 Tax=Tistlia sp. TaxID=3057121 RepID=UPI0034A21426
MSRSKLLAAALAVSVALNLFAGGAFLSSHLFAPSHHGGWAAKREAVQVLPDPERERIDAIWERGRDAVREELRGMRDARRRYREALTAESFDPAKAQAAFEQLYAHKEQLRVSMEAKILEIAAGLPPEQRRAYFEAFFAEERQRDRERERRDRERSAQE